MIAKKQRADTTSSALALATSSSYASPSCSSSSTSDRPIIMEYGLSTQDKLALRKAVKSLGADIRSKIQDVGGLTHFVVGTALVSEGESDGVQAVLARSRNLKQSHALLYGKWIIGPQWIHASLDANKWVSPAPFEVVGDAKVTQFVAGGPERARYSQAKGRGSLFKDTTFFIAPKALRKGMKLHEFEHLLRLADARIFPLSSLQAVLAKQSKEDVGKHAQTVDSSSSSTAITTHVLISEPYHLARNAREPVESGLLVAVTEDWAHDSISNFMLMETDTYKVSVRHGGGRRRR